MNKYLNKSEFAGINIGTSAVLFTFPLLIGLIVYLIMLSENKFVTFIIFMVVFTVLVLFTILIIKRCSIMRLKQAASRNNIQLVDYFMASLRIKGHSRNMKFVNMLLYFIDVAVGLSDSEMLIIPTVVYTKRNSMKINLKEIKSVKIDKIEIIPDKIGTLSDVVEIGETRVSVNATMNRIASMFQMSRRLVEIMLDDKSIELMIHLKNIPKVKKIILPH